MKFHILITLVLMVTASAHHTPQPLNLNKGVIVQLFEWKWLDIAKECEEFLAPNGYAGVQISPPNENIVVTSPVMRPWWERYQPVSYKLNTRSGTEKELQEMLDRCNKKGVRIFADVVLNHMTGLNGNRGTAGSEANYNLYSYPGVPYKQMDFHRPPCEVKNYRDEFQVRFCQLLGMRDLDQLKTSVRETQIAFLNKLISMGVAGFRIESAKHMWPSDLKVIFDRLDHLNTTHGFLPRTRPLIYLEVNDYGTGEAITWNEYRHLGLIADVRYKGELGETFIGQRSLEWLKDYATTPGKIPSDESIVYIDDHNTQRTLKINQLTSPILIPYKMAIAFMLAYPWGTPRILSSYYFFSIEHGPPHDDDYNILSPHPIENNVCQKFWACEHRWRQISNMVQFHNVVAGTEVTNFQSDGDKQAAFCRGNKGFIAFNTNRESEMKKEFQTCLPKGVYCDVISGNLVDNKCTGKVIVVRDNGIAVIEIPATHSSAMETDNVVAIHVKSRVLDKKDANPKTEIEQWCDTSEDLITFCDENKGFIAFSKIGFVTYEKFKTCLPQGTYCDLMSGNYMNNICTGMTLEVAKDGTGTLIKGPVKDYDSYEVTDKFIAIHVGTRLTKEGGAVNEGKDVGRYERPDIVMDRNFFMGTKRKVLQGIFVISRLIAELKADLDTNPICDNLEEVMTKRDGLMTLSIFRMNQDDYDIFNTVSKVGKEGFVDDMWKIIK